MLLAALLALAPIGAVPSAAAARELRVPPPPEGSARLTPDESAPGVDEDEDSAAPDASGSMDAESAEMEALRAVEERAFDSGADRAGALLDSVRQLGPGHPLRQRLEDALEDLDHREDAPAELGLITDLLAFDASLVADRYDIPVEMRPLVAQYIQLFQGPGRHWFRTWISRSTRYIPLMQPILEAIGVPRDTVYLAMIESGFSPRAYSRAHAAGPWQFIPGTGRMFGLKQDFWIDERRDPIKSTHAAARYLKQLRGELGHWYLAWAGYNAGGGRIRRLREKKGSDDFWALAEGDGMAKETRHYVPKLIAAALIAKNPSAFGFTDDEFAYLGPLEYDEVPLVDPTELSVLASAAGISEDELRELNPELTRWCTPPATNDRPYLLHLPKGSAEQFTAALAKIPKQARMRYVEYQVRRGDTLSGIAARFGSSAEVILKFNRLQGARKLRINAELMIPVPQGRGAQASRALEQTTLAARRSGFRHVAENEVPAGTRTAPARGPIKSEAIGGRVRISYGVQDGDSLWTISQRFGCSVDDLRKWNDLPPSGRNLRSGSVLAIWQQQQDGGLRAAPARAPIAAAQPVQSHEISSGDTLWSLAQRYGVSVDQLKRWNDIADHRSVRLGQKLRVYSP
jgi:membrane-bound lytic murein transglycosylase D